MIDLEFSVQFPGREDWPLDGCDTMISSYPTSIKNQTRAAFDDLSLWALELSEAMAVTLRTHFHHGDFVVTDQIETVKRFGIMPEHADCEDCIEGVRTAVRHLTEHPDSRLIVGQLYWSPRP